MRISTWAYVVGLATVLGLGGGCGGGGGGGTAPCGAPTIDVTGTWDVQENAVSSTPGCTEFIVFTADAVQTGAAVSVTTSNGRSFTGTVCGNQLRVDVPFTYPEDGGTTTCTRLTITFDTPIHCTYSSNWTWTDGASSCSGTSSGSGDLL
jgi:hypothetical protein